MKTSGILLPIFSLPSDYGIGCFSKEAYKFVDFLEEAGQKYWQILPLGTIGAGNSPYLSFSSFAGSAYYIDLEQLLEEGLLKKKELESIKEENKGKVDYEKIREDHRKLLRKAYFRFHPDEDYKKFIKDNEYWIGEYAEYMSEKKSKFPESYFCFCQYYFHKQWLALKKYANDKGIQIVGDLPFYVALDGTAFTYHKELFKVDEEGKATVVGGCPPDAFAEDGQVWSNPVYDWEYHKKTDYEWWMKRLRHNFMLYDILRLDHFRGFDEYFEIPAEDETAVNGEWVKGPGMDFFEAMKKELGEKKVIAENLGFLTDSVHKLLDDTGFPGMNVLEFAFGAYDDSIYLPHKYKENSVVYTGTHDNDTVMGWMKTAPKASVKFAIEYLNLTEEEGYNWGMMRAAWSSVADMAIVPMQDLIGLGSEARINIPSTLGENWKWRALEGQITKDLAKKLYKYMQMYGRINEKVLAEQAKKAAEKEAAKKKTSDKKKSSEK